MQTIKIVNICYLKGVHHTHDEQWALSNLIQDPTPAKESPFKD